MTRARKLKNLQPPIDSVVLQRLTDAGITDIEQLQDRFYGDLGTSLRRAEQTLNVPQDVIAGVLAKSLVASSEPLTTPWTRRHWADSMLVIALAYAVFALGRPWPDMWSSRPPLKLPTPQVVAAAAIPVYGMIGEDSLRVRNAVPGVPQEQMTSKFVGRYALFAIAAGAAITEGKLSRKPSDISGRSIVQFEIRRAGALDGRDLPEDVDLIFSARQGAAAGGTVPGRLLAIDMKSTPPLATVALSKDKVAEAAKWVGSSDVYLSISER